MSQYKRPGSNNVPIAVNDVVLITTPEGTSHPGGCGCGACSGGGGAVTGAQGTQGLQGTRGAQGLQGTQGLQGAGNVGSQGTQGVQGTRGAQGTQGLQGGGATLQDIANAIAGAALDNTDDLPEGTTNKYFTIARVSYEHTQGAVSNSWVINHNLGFKPNVTVVDSAGTIYEGEIAYTNTNSLTVTFSSAFSGIAYLS
jgi:hypothetical protein